MTFTFQKALSGGMSLAFSSLIILGLSTLPAAALQQDNPFAEENKAAEDEDPFALSNQVKEAPAAPEPGEQGSAKATPKGKPTPIDDRIDFEITVTPKQVRRGETVQLTITGLPRPGFHTYPLTQRSADPAQDPIQLCSLKYAPAPGLQPLWPVTESEPQLKVIDKVGVFLVHELPFTWKQDILIPPDSTSGMKTLLLTIKAQVCDAKCVWGEPQYEVPIEVSPADPVPLTAALRERLQAKQPEIRVVGGPDHLASPDIPRESQPSSPLPTPPPAKDTDKAVIEVATPQEYQAVLEAILAQLLPRETRDTSLLGFILAGIFWGAVSLVTPCVFPMIPITVSYFLKQSEKANYRPIALAVVYCSTIVIVLTIAAVLLLSFFRVLSFHPLLNIGVGALFVFFALSLFGMYEIELPSSLAQFTSAREGKGGLLGTVFMALTFTILSFACVAPFLGGFGGTAANAKLGWVEQALGGLAFAVTFAAPFFVLALFPNGLRKLPKSGSWLNSVKVVMGFLELAAAFKFFRAAELVMSPRATVVTYDLVLGIWIALCLLCGLYLLNVYRLPHDTPAEHLSVPRLLFSIAFLGLGFYLLPALFRYGPDGEKQRPNGILYAWVDSFLLPEPREGKSSLAWSGNLQFAIDEARAQRQRTGERKLVFLDFTGKS